MSILVTYKRDQTVWIAGLTFQLFLDKICLLLAKVQELTRNGSISKYLLTFAIADHPGLKIELFDISRI